jgi:hypothetical protein
MKSYDEKEIKIEENQDPKQSSIQNKKRNEDSDVSENFTRKENEASASIPLSLEIPEVVVNIKESKYQVPYIGNNYLDINSGSSPFPTNNVNNILFSTSMLKGKNLFNSSK